MVGVHAAVEFAHCPLEHRIGESNGHIVKGGQEVSARRVQEPSGHLLYPVGQYEGGAQSAEAVTQDRSGHITGREAGQDGGVPHRY